MRNILKAGLAALALSVSVVPNAMGHFGTSDCGWQCMINCAAAFPQDDFMYGECVADCPTCSSDDGDNDYIP